MTPAQDREPMPSRSAGQDWLVSWHPPSGRPAGVSHGAAGVCVAGDQLVLISPNGDLWGFPAGRPEGDESLEETLRREVWEEACARVTTARLLGFARSECIAGHEEGRVHVRSFWRADVEVLPWEPRFEIPHRRLVPVADARTHVLDPDTATTRVSFRALAEAGLTS